MIAQRVQLHLGHLVGTLQNRVRLQDTHDTFILVADQHMLTTRLDHLSEIEANIREDVLGNLAVGVDPTKATIYLQSRVPETAELFLYFGDARFGGSGAADPDPQGQAARDASRRSLVRPARIPDPSGGGHPPTEGQTWSLSALTR